MGHFGYVCCSWNWTRPFIFGVNFNFFFGVCILVYCLFSSLVQTYRSFCKLASLRLLQLVWIFLYYFIYVSPCVDCCRLVWSHFWLLSWFFKKEQIVILWIFVSSIISPWKLTVTFTFILLELWHLRIIQAPTVQCSFNE